MALENLRNGEIMANKNPELEALLSEYQNTASSKEEQIVMRKLQLIKAHLIDCDEREFAFTDEIVSELCRIIYNMKKQSENAAVEAEKKLEALSERTTLTGFIGMTQSSGDRPRFETAEELLVAFYNAYRNEQKRKSDAEKTDYPSIERLSDLTEVKANYTIKDYVARINTFARRYMGELPRTMELWLAQPRKIDPAVFTFYNIELVLAEFDTKNEDGSINKQKSNIQSALRKLNEFKKR